MDNEQIICNCIGVTVGDIKNAIDGGAKSFEEVQEITSISTGCGGCEEEAREIVKELLSK